MVGGWVGLGWEGWVGGFFTFSSRISSLGARTFGMLLLFLLLAG